MIAGHFAAGTLIAKPTHAVPHFDGASAFVLMSGLLLGIVHSRWRVEDSNRRLIRRVTVIYLCQLVLCLAAVALTMTRGSAPGLVPVSSWSEGIRYALLLQYMPSGGDILTLYFVLMVAAGALLEALRRSYWKHVLSGSLALYVASQLADPAWFYLPNHSPTGHIVSWAAWQALFVPALVLGWNWQAWDVRARLARRLPAVITIGAVTAVLSIALGEASALAGIDALLGDKLTFGPVRLAAAWVLTLTIYAVLDRMGAVRILRPLNMAGGRSLDAYVLQALLVLAVPLAVAKPWGEVTATLIALAVFCACWGWAETRHTVGIDKLHRAPVAVARRFREPAPATV